MWGGRGGPGGGMDCTHSLNFSCYICANGIHNSNNKYKEDELVSLIS